MLCGLCCVFYCVCWMRDMFRDMCVAAFELCACVLCIACAVFRIVCCACVACCMFCVACCVIVLGAVLRVYFFVGCCTLC